MVFTPKLRRSILSACLGALSMVVLCGFTYGSGYRIQGGASFQPGIFEELQDYLKSLSGRLGTVLRQENAEQINVTILHPSSSEHFEETDTAITRTVHYPEGRQDGPVKTRTVYYRTGDVLFTEWYEPYLMKDPASAVSDIPSES